MCRRWRRPAGGVTYGWTAHLQASSHALSAQPRMKMVRKPPACLCGAAIRRIAVPGYFQVNPHTKPPRRQELLCVLVSLCEPVAPGEPGLPSQLPMRWAHNEK